MEYGCKRDIRYGSICAFQIKEAGKRNKTHNDFIAMEVLGTREITPEKKYPGIGINIMVLRS